MYTSTAIKLRQCSARKKGGGLCRAWATWEDPQQRCVAHGGWRLWRGRRLDWRGVPRARYVPCRCPAYAWPHRPGGGVCLWPQDPWDRCQTPAGTHRYPRFRFRGRMAMLIALLRPHRPDVYR